MLSHIKDILFRWIHHKAYKRAVKKRIGYAPKTSKNILSF